MPHGKWAQVASPQVVLADISPCLLGFIHFIIAGVDGGMVTTIDRRLVSPSHHSDSDKHCIVGYSHVLISVAIRFSVEDQITRLLLSDGDTWAETVLVFGHARDLDALAAPLADSVLCQTGAIETNT